ncbi:MAG TPA: hypothetical protein DEP05_03765 [Betaproteobacteria bacterium]|nr:hypothetical protein [Betaproteobacteria bacterium]
MAFRPFQAWLEARLPRGSEMTLGHRTVYILPTRHGLMFGVMLAVMWVGSINYSLSLGFAFTFLLGSLAIVSIFHTYRNLVGLTLRPGKVEPVFSGQMAVFHICLHSREGASRPALVLQWEGRPPVAVDLPPAGECLALPLPAPQRGLLRPGRLHLFTQFPLGLFRAWAWAAPDMACLVYPQPAGEGAPPPPFGGETDAGGRPDGAGRDDFSGLRGYRPGDSPRHVAWKAVARDDTLLIKEFSGERGGVAWLEWTQLAPFDTETRLSCLARWVIDAERAGGDYGLRLPGQEIAPASGERHRERCLAALALFGERAQ